MRRTRHVTVDLSRRVAVVDRTALADPVLVARVRAGDRASLAVLVERHAPLVARIASGRFGDPDDAKDAGQEVLARMVVGLASYRGEAAFTTWLHRLALNACEDHARRIARRRRRELPDVAAAEAFSEAGAVEDAAVEAADRRALRASLAGLSAPQREAVILKDLLDLRYDEVALLMAVPVGTAKSYAHRGRKRLAVTLRRSA